MAQSSAGLNGKVRMHDTSGQRGFGVFCAALPSHLGHSAGHVGGAAWVAFTESGLSARHGKAQSEQLTCQQASRGMLHGVISTGQS